MLKKNQTALLTLVFITTPKTMTVEISVGHTPDSDDAFMFYGMFTDKVNSVDFTVKHIIEDIEKLNRKAINPELDVTAVSVHACAYIPNYTILRSGGSFGIGYGPIVTAKKMMKAIKKSHPELNIKAFTAAEIFYLSKLTKNSVKEILSRLKDAGLDSM